MRSARILFTSAGRRVELIGCFRRAAQALDLKLDVLACDLEPDLSAACRLSDRAFAVPRVDDPGYVDAVCTIVERHGVDLVVPTIDPELPPLAAARDRFAALGAHLHVSAPSVVDVARDKRRTSDLFAGAGIAVPRTADLDEVRRVPEAWDWPVFVKPKGGSASRSLAVVRRADDLPETVAEPMIVQELLTGPEYTVNMFVDRSGRLRAVVPHLRIRVRAGEVEKGRTERRPEFADIARRVLAALPEARGALCFQLIEDRRAGPKVIEINARFGGGYPLADHAGAPFARWLLEEWAGLPSSASDDWRAGVTMIRYDTAIFLE